MLDFLGGLFGSEKYSKVMCIGYLIKMPCSVSPRNQPVNIRPMSLHPSLKTTVVSTGSSQFWIQICVCVCVCVCEPYLFSLPACVPRESYPTSKSTCYILQPKKHTSCAVSSITLNLHLKYCNSGQFYNAVSNMMP